MDHLISKRSESTYFYTPDKVGVLFLGAGWEMLTEKAGNLAKVKHQVCAKVGWWHFNL